MYYPLQVFSYFLSEFSELEWTQCAITIHGPVPFVNNIPLEKQFSNEELITQELIDKYYDIIYLHEYDINNISNTGNESNDFIKNFNSNNTYRTQQPLSFHRKSMNIVHPFFPEVNMISDISLSNISDIKLFLHESASMLQLAFDHSLTSTDSVFCDYFRILSNTFGKGWRPNIPCFESVEKFFEILRNERDRERERGVEVESFNTDILGCLGALAGDTDNTDVLEYHNSADSYKYEYINYFNLYLVNFIFIFYQ